MTMQMLLNLLIAIVWMLLNEAWTVPSFVVGFFIGMIIVFTMRRFFPTPFYGRKLWALLKLLYLFIVELFLSSITVIRQVTRPKLDIEPGIFRTETILKSDWEITLLSVLITLTPGSVVMEVDPRKGVMFIHAMDATEFKSSIMKSKHIFEKAITEVSR